MHTRVVCRTMLVHLHEDGQVLHHFDEQSDILRGATLVERFVLIKGMHIIRVVLREMLVRMTEVVILWHVAFSRCVSKPRH